MSSSKTLLSQERPLRNAQYRIMLCQCVILLYYAWSISVLTYCIPTLSHSEVLSSLRQCTPKCASKCSGSLSPVCSSLPMANYLLRSKPFGIPQESASVITPHQTASPHHLSRSFQLFSLSVKPDTRRSCLCRGTRYWIYRLLE